MYILLAYSLFLWGCNNDANKTEGKEDSATGKLKIIDSIALRSSGLYSGVVPCADCEGIITHLLLNPDLTFRLEEIYSKKDDKVNRTNGSWKMENGKIELYANNELVVSYLGEGEKLLQLDHAGNRISGNLGHKYVLDRKPIADKKNWKEKSDAGIDFIGMGNEPFWGLEIDKGNKISFNNPDMKEPFNSTYIAPISSNGNQEYHIESGTAKLDIIITPQFCSDGMSDFVYDYSISIDYNGKKYSGCGVLLNDL